MGKPRKAIACESSAGGLFYAIPRRRRGDVAWIDMMSWGDAPSIPGIAEVRRTHRLTAQGQRIWEWNGNWRRFVE